MKKITLILLVSICFTGALTWQSYGNNQPPESLKQKWKYTTLVLRIKPHYEYLEETELNKYGKDGWELVGFTSEERSINADKTNRVHVFYFKRPL